jgi:hypothetical protein
LSTNSKKLNVFGDSFATPGVCVAPSQSFWGLMAQDLDVDSVDNYSQSGFSLDHVIHILLNETFDFDCDYFVIGIPPLLRYVEYSDSFNTTWNRSRFDNKFTETQQTISCLNNTHRFRYEDRCKNQVVEYSAEWADVQALEKIYLLHQFLNLKQTKFMMVNLTRPIIFQDSWSAGKSIMYKTKQLSECILFDNTFYSTNFDDQIKPADYDQYGWVGHHGALGNSNWYNKVIKPKMIELNWISHA